MHATHVLAVAIGQQVVPARAQMATTLGFHIILACFGIALPSIVLLAEFIGLRRGNETAMRLARRWSQVMGVLVAVGAVTGTVLSFEMGLLWPGLMRQYGSVLGVPFGVEGLFFFLEAIFAGIYLWGWRRLPGWAHWWSGVPIAVSGIFGAMSVIAVNAWMNTPGGFTEARRPDHLGRRVAGVLQPLGHLRDAAHDPGRLHGRGLRRGLGVRGGHPARPPRPLPLHRVRARVRPGRDTDPVPDLRRRHRGPRHRADQPVKFAAMEYVAADLPAGPGVAGRGLRQRAHLRRDQDPLPGLAAGRVRSRVPRSSAGTACPRPTGRRWCG
jgi:hypothetical protein